MTIQVTHSVDPDTGRYMQIVTPAVLRAVLDAFGDDYSRPAWFAAGDEWDTGDTGEEE